MKRWKVAVIVMILVVGLFGCVKSDAKSCETLVKKFEQAINSTNVSLLEQTYVPCFFQEMKNDYSDVESFQEGIARSMSHEVIHMEFLGATQLPLEEGYDSLEDDVLEAHKDEIDKIYVVRVLYQEEIWGYESTEEIMVVKMGRRWYVADMFF